MSLRTDARPPDVVAGVPPAPPPTRRRRRRGPDLRRWISPVAVLALWQLASAVGVLPPEKLESPWVILKSGVEVTRSGELADAFLVSVGRVSLGFALGLVVAVVLGVVAGLSEWGNALADPPLQMLRTLPFLGLVPLFILWFGIGETPKVLLVALGVTFPIYLNLHSGIRSVDRDLVEATTALGFTWRERLLHVVLPAAVPQTLVGLRQSLGIAWLALIVAESVNTEAGIGFMINNARDFLRTDVIVVGLIVYAVLGLVTDAAVRLIEHHALRWRTP